MKETNLKTYPNLRKNPKITMRSHPSKYQIKRKVKQLHVKSFFVKNERKEQYNPFSVKFLITRLNPNQHFNV